VKRREFVQGLGVASLAAASGASAVEADPGHYARFLALISDWKRHDIDAVVARLADDVVWYVAVGAAPVEGREASRQLLETFAPRRKAENWRIFHHAVNGDRLFVEGVDDFEDDQGRRVAVPYAGVIEFRDGLITGWRDYFDMATLNRMKAGEPIPAELLPLVDRPGEP
jgi:limonene-1,2-epoxide hydrolase